MLSKKKKVLIRFILASIIGGLYSIIIFAEGLPTALLWLTKIISAFLIVFVAFRFSRVTQYMKTVFLFFISSVIILGVTIALCYIFNLDFIAINNSVMYFDISAQTIILSALCAYLLSSVVLRLYNRTLSKKDIFSLVITNNGNTVNLVAFLDTGNRLREPFSNMPVIIVKKAKCEHIIGDTKTRLVPATTVNKTDFIVAFKPDNIILKSSKGEEVIENVYVGLVEDLGCESYQAILNYDILSI